MGPRSPLRLITTFFLRSLEKGKEKIATRICQWKVIFASISGIYLRLRALPCLNCNLREIFGEHHSIPSRCLILLISFLRPLHNFVFFLVYLVFFLVLNVICWTLLILLILIVSNIFYGNYDEHLIL